MKKIIAGIIALIALGLIVFNVVEKETIKSWRDWVLNLFGYKVKKPSGTKVSSPKNIKHIDSLHPLAKPVFLQFLNEIEKMGFRYQVNSTYRSFKDQQRMVDSKQSSTPPGHSLHNYGLAVDLQVSKDGKSYGKFTSDKEWLSTGIPQLAKSKYKMRWGGDFGEGKKQDAIHFDLPLKPAKELLLIAQAQFGKKPSEIQGNKINIV